MVSNYFRQNNDFYGIHKNDILNKVKNIVLKDKDYKFKYSNFGIAVIGLVLEQVYDEDFVTLMNDFIENDLNLKNTKVALSTGNLSGYWNWKEDDGYIPAGAIISNIEDMIQYLKYYMNCEDNYISNTYAELKSINANNSIYEKMNIRMDKVGMTWLIDEKIILFGTMVVQVILIVISRLTKVKKLVLLFLGILLLLRKCL